MKTKMFCLRLPEDLAAALDAKAKAEDRPVAYIVKRAILGEIRKGDRLKPEKAK